MNNFIALAFIKKIQAGVSDDELKQQYVQTGDMELLGELYGRYMDLIYGVCLKYLKEPEEAKDAVMMIFEELTVKLRKYEVQKFGPWLYQLAKNHCLMKIRSGKTKPVNTEADLMYLAEDVHHEDVILKEAQLNTMEYCIEQLPAEQMQAVKLFYLSQKCYKDIADETGHEIGKVRSYIQNGKRNLKICMDKQLAEKATQ